MALGAALGSKDRPAGEGLQPRGLGDVPDWERVTLNPTRVRLYLNSNFTLQLHELSWLL